MCDCCEGNLSLLKENDWEVWIDYYNYLQLVKNDLSSYILIKYCPMCGKKLEERK